MPRSFKDRLAALEALEAEPPPSPLVLSVAGLSEDDLFAAVFNGLRAGTLFPARWWIVGVDPYWTAVAERASDIYEERGCWVCPITPDEARLVADALRAGRLLVRDWPGHQPPISGAYQILPPEPYPIDHWETPLHAAVESVQFGLRIWREIWRDVAAGPPLPATEADVIAWLNDVRNHNAE